MAACALVSVLATSLLIDDVSLATIAQAELLQTTSPTPAPGTGDIAGSAWEDLNGDSFHDPDEPPLAEVYIAAENGQLSVSDLTDATGNYRLIGLQPGTYRVSAVAPPGYVLTSPSGYDVYVAAGAVLTFNFGAQYVPTPTPTSTPPPILDATDAERAFCGGIYQADTSIGKADVSRYACRPAWDEGGPELVYRIEVNIAQPLSVSLLSAAADLDLFLLRYVYPESCLAAGDNFLTYAAEPGVYLLAVDGYQGAAGAFSLRVDCPNGVQATATPTFTPSPTPTQTLTPTPGPTATRTATASPQHLYLPQILRTAVQLSAPIALTLQQGAGGYAGVADTTLDGWLPDRAHGADDTLRLFHARPPQVTTQKAPILRFDLAMLPADAQVSAAELRLYLVTSAAYDLRGQAHGLLRSWDEQTATWWGPAAGQTWGEPGAQGRDNDYMSRGSDPQQIHEGERWYHFDVTDLATMWARDPASNAGVIVLARPGDSNANVEARFASREFDIPELRPQLVITYAVPVRTAGP